MAAAADDRHPDPEVTPIGAAPGTPATPQSELRDPDSDVTIVREDRGSALEPVAATSQVVLAPALTQAQAVAISAGTKAPQPLGSFVSLPDAAIATTGPADPSKRRAALLFAAGLATVAVAYALAPGGNGAGVVEAMAPARGAAALPGKSTSAAMLAPPRRGPLAVQAAADPFVGTSFAPPPPPPPPPAPVVVAPPPPPPKAPPLPYSFVGMLEKGPGKPAAFISRGSTLLVVSAGDVVDGSYRVDVLNPSEIVMTYLPLNQRQSLNLSGKNP